MVDPIVQAIEALERIRDLEPGPFEMPKDWSEQIAACPQCQRYKNHPIQQGICNDHRQPIWDRDKHDAFEARAIGHRAKSIARTALAALRAMPRVTDNASRAFVEATSGIVSEYLADYELRGDEGDYTPNASERILLEDFGEGVLYEFQKALNASGLISTRSAQPGTDGRPNSIKIYPLERIERYEREMLEKHGAEWRVLVGYDGFSTTTGLAPSLPPSGAQVTREVALGQWGDAWDAGARAMREACARIDEDRATKVHPTGDANRHLIAVLRRSSEIIRALPIPARPK